METKELDVKDTVENVKDKAEQIYQEYRAQSDSHQKYILLFVGCVISFFIGCVVSAIL